MSLSTTRSIAELQAEAERPSLRRVLGPLNLTALGIGSVIGTGIFVLTGTAASQNAGPALVLSMIIAAVACALAGLCYAELASMIPVAGSAYTYAYASSGEFVAWIIGWDLMLEYALSASTIAVGWSGYLVSFLHDLGVVLPPALTAAPEVTAVAADGTVVPGVFNLPAAVIVLLVTALLVAGIRQSANANTVLVVLKVAVLIVFVALGAAYVQREHRPVRPLRVEWSHAGLGRDLLRLHRVRRGLYRRAGGQEPAA
jgi:basic amino acid/polyamine antiporter, APA family